MFPTKKNQMPDDLMFSAAESPKSSFRAAGFSLLELIIAMLVFLIVSGAVYGVLVAAQRSRTTVNQQTQMNKSVRLSLNLLGRDTYNAGFDYPIKYSVNLPDNRISTLIKVPDDTNTTLDTVPAVIAGNDITVNTFNTTGTEIKTDQVTFLFKDTSFNLVAPNPAFPNEKESQALNVTTQTVSGVNQVTIAGATSSPCNVNDLFVIAGASGSALGVATEKSGSIVKFASGDSLKFNDNGTAAPIALVTGNASMQRVKLITYFVTADGILTRREFANVTPAENEASAASVDEPLVYGVENFQIQYILDDGTITDNPSAGANGKAGDNDDDQTKLALVRQIAFTVTAKTLEVNAKGEPYRVTMSSTFATRNLGYNAD